MKRLWSWCDHGEPSLTLPQHARPALGTQGDRDINFACMKSLRFGNSLCSRHNLSRPGWHTVSSGCAKESGRCSLRNALALPAQGTRVEQDGFQTHVYFLTKATATVPCRKDFHMSCHSDPTCTPALPEHVAHFQFRKQGPHIGRWPHIQRARADGRHLHIHPLIQFLQEEPCDADGTITLNLRMRVRQIWGATSTLGGYPASTRTLAEHRSESGPSEPTPHAPSCPSEVDGSGLPLTGTVLEPPG